MRVVVVGTGFMGGVHIRAWQRIPGVELAGIVSNKQELVVASAGNLSASDEPLDLSNVRRYSTLQEALDDLTADAIDICTPTYLHAAIAVNALQCGKHVLVEKLMALSNEECSQMIAAARESGRLLMVGHVIRFWGDYQPLIEAVRSGTLGPMRSLDLRRRCAAPAWGVAFAGHDASAGDHSLAEPPWLSDSYKSGGGAFDLLIHDVDLCVALFGLPQSASATGSIDHLSATLNYGDVDSVTISGGWHAASSYPFSMSHKARLEEGTIEFSSRGKPVTLYRSNGEIGHPAGSAIDGFEAELAYFAECVRSHHPVDRCPPHDSASAVRLLQVLLQSCKERGKIIKCT